MGRRTIRLLPWSAGIGVSLLCRRPALGRPLVDTVTGSKLTNLKELRPGSSGTSEVRLLFVFDPTRQAVFLVGGNKAGNWQRWYDRAIPEAEQAYEQYLQDKKEKGGKDG